MSLRVVSERDGWVERRGGDSGGRVWGWVGREGEGDEFVVREGGEFDLGEAIEVCVVRDGLDADVVAQRRRSGGGGRAFLREGGDGGIGEFWVGY